MLKMHSERVSGEKNRKATESRQKNWGNDPKPGWYEL